MKDPNRPRAAHKLHLQDGDRVKLVGWQDGSKFRVSEVFTVRESKLRTDSGVFGGVRSVHPKGQRPLFTVVSRAAQPAPDVQIVFCGNPVPHMGFASAMSFFEHKYRFILTFPAGGNTGTVVKEKL